MNAKKFKRISYLIVATVLITVGIQVYRNVQNYQVNKQRFILDVQQSLDLAVENYYANRAKGDVLVFSTGATFGSTLDSNSSKWNLSTYSKPIDTIPNSIKRFTSFTEYAEHRNEIRDSLNAQFNFNINRTLSFDSIEKVRLINGVTIRKSDTSELKNMAKKIFLSLVNSSIDFVKLDSFLLNELDRKEIDLKYLLVHTTQDSVFYSNDAQNRFKLISDSKSTYLPDDENLQINYENASLVILKRGILDMLISLLIIGAVSGSLFYLYLIIAEQKELAEIKNDLISNITHEFKTPIATISTAIEGISNFNKANDPEKTAKYLDISSGQLKKLNGMVEKLLETATLDSDELDLSLEPIEVVSFTRQVFERFHLLKGDKKLAFQTALVSEFKDLDVFHFENAISNLLDNAIKYGGEEIQISLEKRGEQFVWTVTDNGGKLDKTQQERIFDKFYRVPTGNVHDVKGFGIGLYYTKKIVEKHGGTISLQVANSETEFTLAI